MYEYEKDIERCCECGSEVDHADYGYAGSSGVMCVECVRNKNYSCTINTIDPEERIDYE